MNVTNRKMFRPRTARNKLNQMGGIMASSPELMNTVARFQTGGPVVDPYFARMTQQNLPAIRPGSFAAQPITSIQDFIGRANRESGIGQIQQANQMARAGVTPDDLARVSAATQANQAANQLEAQMSAGANPTMRGPTASLAQMGQDINVFESMMDAGSIPTMRGPTAADVSAAQPETAAQPTMPTPSQERRAGADSPTMRGPTAKDAQGFLSVLPEVTPEQVQAADPRDQARLGQEIKNQATEFLASDAPETEKNDAILTLLGQKDPNKKLTSEERIEKNKEFYRRIFKQDPAEDEKVDGYNLAMMGFLIASGDSPNALQNIARGAAAGLKNFQDTRKERRARDDKLTELAVADYRSQVKSEAEREEFMMNYNLELQKLMDRRAEAKSEAERERINTILGMKDSATGLALLQLEKSGVDIGTEKGFDRLMSVRSDLIERFPDLRSEDSGFRDRRNPEEDINNALANYFDMDRIDKMDADNRIRAELNLSEDQPITRDIARRYFTGAFMPDRQQTASGAQEPPVISTREEYDALAPGAFFIQNGQQRQKPVQ